MTKFVPTAPLPGKFEDLVKVGKLAKKNLKDEVQEAVKAGYGNPDFKRFITAVDNGDSETGKCEYDNIYAAQWLIDNAPEGSQLAAAKVVDVKPVMNRYLTALGISLKQRRVALPAPQAQAAA